MESVTKHDTSSLKLQGRRSLRRAVLPALEAGTCRKHAIWSAVTPHRRADCQNAWKHACSLSHIKHFKEELCDAAPPQRRPGTELQRARAFGCRRRGATAPAHDKCAGSSAVPMQEQVRDNTQINRRSLRGNIHAPRKLSYVCRFH